MQSFVQTGFFLPRDGSGNSSARPWKAKTGAAEVDNTSTRTPTSPPRECLAYDIDIGHRQPNALGIRLHAYAPPGPQPHTTAHTNARRTQQHATAHQRTAHSNLRPHTSAQQHNGHTLMFSAPLESLLYMYMFCNLFIILKIIDENKIIFIHQTM